MLSSPPQRTTVLVGGREAVSQQWACRGDLSRGNLDIDCIKPYPCNV